jgi:hypothetical protein
MMADWLSMLSMVAGRLLIYALWLYMLAMLAGCIHGLCWLAAYAGYAFWLSIFAVLHEKIRWVCWMALPSLMDGCLCYPYWLLGYAVSKLTGLYAGCLTSLAV